MIPATIIRVIDLETTGFAPPEAEPIEIGWCDVYATRRDLAGEPAGWEVDFDDSLLIEPKGPIPPETSAIHHLTAEDFRQGHPMGAWEDAGRRMVWAGDNQPLGYYAAHNAAFERQFITADWTLQAAWICTYKCALRLWPEAPAHSNQALRYWRGLPVHRHIANQAHRAGPDAYVTAHLLRDMLEQPGVTLDKLVTWSSEPALLAKCHIGRYRGQRWSEIDDKGFLFWLLERDFSEDVKHTARFHIDRLRQAEEAQVHG